MDIEKESDDERIDLTNDFTNERGNDSTDDLTDKVKFIPKAKRILNGGELLRAKMDLEVLTFILKQLPLKEEKLVARISVLYHHSNKWCKKKIAHLLSLGLIEYEEKEKFYVPIIHATDIFEKYLRSLKINIRKYEKIVEKEQKEHEEWLRQYSNRLMPIEQGGDDK